MGILDILLSSTQASAKVLTLCSVGALLQVSIIVCQVVTHARALSVCVCAHTATHTRAGAIARTHKHTHTHTRC